MLRRIANIARIKSDDAGSMAIETAFVTPILLVLALAGFEVSSMVARQTELQSAAAEAAAVVRATIPDTAEKQNTVRDIVATSLCNGSTPTVGDNGAAVCGNTSVAVSEIYRCGVTDAYTTVINGCGVQAEYKFIQIDLRDTYQPVWTKFGITSGFNYNISRTVQIG